MFFKAVIDRSLTLRAATPSDCLPVIESTGQQHNAGFPELGYRRHALLSRNAIMNLAVHGEAETKDVALEPGDPDFMTWPEIKARRQQREVELAQRAFPADEWDALPAWSRWRPAEFMGESDVYTLSQWVKVTDDTCRVPRETIEELLEKAQPKRAQPVSSVAIGGTKHLIKRNSLDGPLEQAMQRAGSTSTGNVWVHLRELALEGTLPFTGLVQDDALHYTNDKKQHAMLSKEALKKRLQKYRLQGAQ